MPPGKACLQTTLDLLVGVWSMPVRWSCCELRSPLSREVCSHARETCRFDFGKAKVFHFGLADPPWLAVAARSDEERLSHYRRVRDEYPPVCGDAARAAREEPFPGGGL